MSSARRRLAPDEFRDVIGRFASGVTVVTTAHEGQPFGTTASAVSSLSLEPPMVLVCLNRSSETGRAIGASRRFAINVLGQGQHDTARRFARKGGEKFAGVEVTAGAWEEPLLVEALATLECRVVEETSGGTHIVFLAEVDRASARPGAPLAYFRGEFHALAELSTEPAADDADALLARESIELGAAARSVGAVDDARLAEAERLARAAGKAAGEDAEALTAFLEQMVGLAGSTRLLSVYRGLPVPAGLSSEDHLALVEAHRAADFPAAAAIVRRRYAAG